MDGMQPDADFEAEAVGDFDTAHDSDSLPSNIVGIVYGDVGTSELKCSVTAPLEKGELQ